MTDQKLRELLEQLHEELGQTESVDEKGKELLANLNADIQKILRQPENTRHSIREQLREAIDHFEVKHPAITAALSRILDALSNAGI